MFLVDLRIRFAIFRPQICWFRDKHSWKLAADGFAVESPVSSWFFDRCTISALLIRERSSSIIAQQVLDNEKGHAESSDEGHDAPKPTGLKGLYYNPITHLVAMLRFVHLMGPGSMSYGLYIKSSLRATVNLYRDHLGAFRFIFSRLDINTSTKPIQQDHHHVPRVVSLVFSVSGPASDDNEWDILKWLPLSFKLVPGTRSGDSRFVSKV
ncbi:hypothetical protein ARMSODRAFT_1088109 [Armillaria solidipes]|uniref:Uncharacterized protein n=1 Tax=Armillaria solidipes TaxID=1076256 RepID=A0A2H3AZW5_9AGAR|nr:hypothetical protein ARMSODRAFT_1088109 [Armillaria solidipes]